jgi:hypothetical protein
LQVGRSCSDYPLTEDSELLAMGEEIGRLLW